MDTNNKPIHVVRCGNIRAACWLNRSESGTFFNTKVERVYFDKSTEQFGESNAFTDYRDLLAVAFVTQEMCRWICERRRADADEPAPLQESAPTTPGSATTPERP